MNIEIADKDVLCVNSKGEPVRHDYGVLWGHDDRSVVRVGFSFEDMIKLNLQNSFSQDDILNILKSTEGNYFFLQRMILDERSTNTPPDTYCGISSLWQAWRRSHRQAHVLPSKDFNISTFFDQMLKWIHNDVPIRGENIKNEVGPISVK